MPYKEDQSGVTTFFELEIQGKPIGYFTEITGLAAEVETLTYSEGGMNEFQHRLPTRTKYPNLVLKRGMTTKADLQQWFQKTQTQAERTGIRVSMMDTNGDRLRTWSFVNAFPVKWTGPNFNSTQSALAVESVEVAHEGLEAI
jgi:phage tail-like protein